MYQADQIKSRHDSSFICLGIDGSDQMTTYCPQLWMSHLHKDMPENSYVEQKVMVVVVHGMPDETVFYVCDPRVKSGMDLTVNCLMDALTHRLPAFIEDANAQTKAALYGNRCQSNRVNNKAIEVNNKAIEVNKAIEEVTIE
jgi:hypothetical protein